MTSIILKHTPARPCVFLNEISGRDELIVIDVGTPSALNLLDGLLINGAASKDSPLKAEKITTADRDRLLATLYVALYGVTIDSTITCQSCGERFDLDFSLDGLQEHLRDEQNETVADPLEDGTYRLPSGCRFRLPTGEDELAIAGCSGGKAAEMLLERCILEGDPATDGEQVQQAMAQLAPMLQTEMKAICPECGQEQQVLFDIQSFLLNRLKNERKQTSWEIHRLASTYKWSHQEILDLPRSLRRLYVGYIESEG